MKAAWRTSSSSLGACGRGGRTTTVIGAGPGAGRGGRLADQFGDQGEADLAAAGQLDIDLGEQLRVEQRAVLDPLRAIDAEAGAERVEAVLRAGEFLAGEAQRADHPRHAHRRPSARSELMVDEAEIEDGIVRDERRIADEGEQFLAAVGEARLVGKEAVGQAVHLFRLARHRPARVEIGMEGAAGLDPVEHLDAADLDHAVAAGRAEARGLGVEDDLAHPTPMNRRRRRGKRGYAEPKPLFHRGNDRSG